MRGGVTETLEGIPREWKGIPHVREKVSWPDCECTRRAPAAAVFYYSRDRGGAHPQAHLADYAGILQADAYGGYGKLYEANRQPGPITQAACWSHARRKFFVLADLAASARRRAEGKTP